MQLVLPRLGRRILAYLLLRRPQQPEPQPLSAAQRCNEDVLDEIFSQLSRRDLASVARVCQAWLHPARRALYHDLQFEAAASYAPALAAVLREQPVLRSLIRRLLLYIPYRTRDPSIADWIKLLPEHSLRSVDCSHIAIASDSPTGRMLPLLEFPAISTTPHLGICCPTFLSPDRLYKVLDMQHLESLSITIPYFTWPETSFHNVTAFPRLRRLSLWSDVYSPLIEELLLSLPLPLERFDFCSKLLGEAELASLRNGLSRHTPHLRHVSFFGPSLFKVCFLDDYVSCLPSLETLLCGYPLYSPEIISRLPPTATSLTLCAPHKWTVQIPSDELAAALQQNRNRLSRLKAITIVRKPAWEQRCDSLEAVCAKEGIQFEAVDEQYLLSIWK